jgi:hypothetical protein
MSVIPDNVGIRSSPICPKKVRIVGISIAVSSVNRFAGRPFTHETFCSNPTILEIDMAVFDAESADCSISVEVDFLEMRCFRKKELHFHI